MYVLSHLYIFQQNTFCWNVHILPENVERPFTLSVLCDMTLSHSFLLTLAFPQFVSLSLSLSLTWSRSQTLSLGLALALDLASPHFVLLSLTLSCT